MEFSGRYEIPAPPPAVWEAINDPEILRRSIPGAESVEKTAENEFAAEVTVKIGPVKARFTGKVTLSDAEPPHGCTLRGEGTGGAAGFAKGEADIRLEPGGPGTILTYHAKATIGGRLAQLGQRLIDGAAKSIADEFFAKFAATFAEGAPGTAAAGTQADEPRPEAGLGPEIWVVGLLGVIAVLLVLFGVVL